MPASYLDRGPVEVPTISRRPIDVAAPAIEGATDLTNALLEVQKKQLDAERQVKAATAEAQFRTGLAEAEDKAKQLPDPAAAQAVMTQHIGDIKRSLLSNERDPAMVRHINILSTQYGADAQVRGTAIRSAKTQANLQAALELNDQSIIRDSSGGDFDLTMANIRANHNRGIGSIYAGPEDAKLGAQRSIQKAFADKFYTMVETDPEGARGFAEQHAADAGINHEALVNKYHAELIQQSNLSYAIRKQQDKLTGDGIESQAVRIMLRDPNANITTLMDQLAVYDPSGPNRLINFRQNLANRTTDDPEYVAGMLYRIHTQPQEVRASDITSGLVNGKITVTRAEALLNNLENMRTKTEDPRLNDPIVREVRDKIMGAVRKGTPFLPDPASEANARQAAIDFLEHLEEFTTANPTASVVKVRNEAREKGDALIKRYASAEVVEGLKVAGTPSLIAALRSDPATVDWVRQPLFKDSKELRSAFDEYNATKSGPLAELAQHLGMDRTQIQKLVESQLRLLGQSGGK